MKELTIEEKAKVYDEALDEFSGIQGYVIETGEQLKDK